jgi:hypothetical protein
MIPNDIQSENVQQWKWYQVFTDVAAIVGVSFGIIFFLIDTKFAQVRIERAFGVLIYVLLDGITMLIAIGGIGFACWKGIKILMFFKRIKITNDEN